ncbi:DnaJ domain-containing protein [Aromatoleum toluolicum]|nr:DnaJ domain-containing protein [Aromatoleum toluolicum]MCQ6963956.1 DnaJ domain-containing protein [Aromatoleum toluolicum]
MERNATPDEVKKAFRRLARKYHPDVSKETQAEVPKDEKAAVPAMPDMDY